jgi:NAD-dependent deacetylase
MFGEPVPTDTMARAREQIDRADCVLAVGTSATVRPASGLLWIAKANGARLIEVNPAETKLTGVCDVVVRATAGWAIPSLVERLERRCRHTTRAAAPT